MHEFQLLPATPLAALHRTLPTYATLLASVLKPHRMNVAPTSAENRYPSGMANLPSSAPGMSGRFRCRLPTRTRHSLWPGPVPGAQSTIDRVCIHSLEWVAAEHSRYGVSAFVDKEDDHFQRVEQIPNDDKVPANQDDREHDGDGNEGDSLLLGERERSWLLVVLIPQVAARKAGDVAFRVDGRTVRRGRRQAALCRCRRRCGARSWLRRRGGRGEYGRDPPCACDDSRARGGGAADEGHCRRRSEDGKRTGGLASHSRVEYCGRLFDRGWIADRYGGSAGALSVSAFRSSGMANGSLVGLPRLRDRRYERQCRSWPSCPELCTLLMMMPRWCSQHCAITVPTLRRGGFRG